MSKLPPTWAPTLLPSRYIRANSMYLEAFAHCIGKRHRSTVLKGLRWCPVLPGYTWAFNVIYFCTVCLYTRSKLLMRGNAQSCGHSKSFDLTVRSSRACVPKVIKAHIFNERTSTLITNEFSKTFAVVQSPADTRKCLCNLYFCAVFEFLTRIGSLDYVNHSLGVNE